MITKTKLKEHLKSLPENFSIDELIDRLIFVEKIEKGDIQSKNKEVISENEIDKEMGKWFS